jgi:polygalacturonase
MRQFWACEDAQVLDLSVIHSSAWTLVPIFSKSVVFKRFQVGPGLAPFHSNTNGFDSLGSEDCSFEDGYYASPGDDYVAIKSGIQVNWTVPYIDVCKRPTRGIYVNNVACVTAHGITIRSEIFGGVEDVMFTNMRLLNSP